MMDRRAWIAGLSLLFLGACNWVDGACWLKSDDNAGSGAGGGPIIPGGGGGFGDAPEATPQDVGDPPPPPECLQVPQGKCYEKCLSDYSDAASQCGKIESSSQRITCQNEAYTAYKVCRENCAMIESEWRKACEEQAEKCEDICRKKPDGQRGPCWEKCNNEYGECTKRCKG